MASVQSCLVSAGAESKADDEMLVWFFALALPKSWRRMPAYDLSRNIELVTWRVAHLRHPECPRRRPTDRYEHLMVRRALHEARAYDPDAVWRPAVHAGL